MEWYYVDAGKSTGPISEPQLVDLIKAGKVTPDTLLWREGMTEWKPCKGVGPRVAASEIKAAPAPVAEPAVASETCVQCGQTFPRDDMMKFENAWVCVNCKPVFLQKLKEGVSVTGAFEYAGFWIRFGAKFIDNILLQIVNYALIIPIIGFGGLKDSTATGVALVIQMLVSFAIQIGYITFFLGKYGATPGKMACKLKVVNPDGTPISYGKAFGRFWGEILSGITLSIGYLIVIWDEEKRALHDRVCNTRVIRNG
jgi:uncharacterized RDD family membrane protein YckC